MNNQETIPLTSVEINPEYISDTLIQFKKDLETAINNIGTPKSFKDTNMTSDYLNPYVPVHLARYAYTHSSTLRSIVESFSQDIFLNDYSLSDPEEDSTSMNLLWNSTRNKYQLYLAGIENFIYGYGACELTQSQKGITVSQIPAHTLKLRKIPFTNPLLNRTYYFYYAEQTVDGYTVLLKLIDYDYSMLDDFGINHGATGECLWIGGCNENPFFDIPRWIAKRRSLFTDMAIDEYNSRKIERGNINAGLLLITGPLERHDPHNPDEKGIDTKIEEGLHNGDCGTIVQYLGSTSTSTPINMQYQVFEDNNYEYFGFLQDRCVNDLLRAFKMPKVRLAIDDSKESMNSHKSDTLYEIYNREIFATQMFIQPKLDLYNQLYCGIKSDVIIGTPEFTDKTSTRVSTAVELFNEGLFTLGECLKLLAPVYPDIDFTNEGYDEVLFNSRFYHGQLLGSKPEEYTDENKIDSIITNINGMLEKDGHELLK